MKVSKVKKVVIPMAGLGTRMLPATKVLPKEMLPVAGKPIIQLILKEALDSGFSEIIFVINKSKALVENFFDKNIKLEIFLKNRSQNLLLKEIKDISKIKANIVSVLQDKPKGLGHAITCASPLLSGEAFAVMLPDMILDSNNRNNNLALMKKNFEKTGISSILLGKAKKSDVQNYGIVKINKRDRNNIFFPIENILEKPSPEKAPSNLFAVGRYIFENEILSYLKREKPDSSGEIQLSGAISNFLKDSNTINGLPLDGAIHDCGNKLGYLIANLAYSFKDPNFKKEVLKFIKK